jgi:hypothetical protein
MRPQFDALIYVASIWVIPLIIAITFHEAAHGYVARFFGDSTAWQFGRVTLNPFKHIDPIGTILLPALLFMTRSPFLFGYAKPVPVNFRALRNPRRDMVWVAAAGPGMNIALAVTAHAAAPVLALCRKLVAAEHDPALPLEAYRGDVLCLRVRSIGKAAGLEINGEGTGFRRRVSRVEPGPCDLQDTTYEEVA